MLVNCFVLDWRMSLVVFGVVPVTLFPVVRLGKQAEGRHDPGRERPPGGSRRAVQEVLGGIRVVQAFGMEGWESRRFADGVRAYIRAVRRGYLVRAFSSPLMEVMAAAGIALAIWWVGGRILAGEIEAGEVLLLHRRGDAPLPAGEAARARGPDRDRRRRRRRAHLRDPGRAEARSRTRGTRMLAPFQRRDPVRAGRLLVRRRARRAPRLRPRDPHAARSSRSSARRAAGRPPSRTCCRASGTRPRAGSPSTGWTSATRRSRACARRSRVVTQETVLFDDTIRANIAYGRPDVPLAEVERAARLADAHDFICALAAGVRHRASASGARGSPAASGSGSPSRARS